MDTVSVPEIVYSLASDDDGVRKKAAFRLQSLIGDPSFSDAFILEGGLARLQHLVKYANGNTLAYSLASFSNLLDLDLGWDHVDDAVVQRLVGFVTSQPLVNILRGAMSILAAVVSHPQLPTAAGGGAFGLGALGPAISKHRNFLEMLVSRLSSDDHALCANALMLINSLMRDSVMNGSDAEWPKFMKRLQELGAIKAIYALMQSPGLQDLGPPLLEFQGLIKILLRKWRELPVSLERPEHQKAFRTIYLGAYPKRRRGRGGSDGERTLQPEPEKWRRLGFDTDEPMSEFEHVGFLGVMDLMDYVRKSEAGFGRLLLEQSSRPAAQRCPIAKASLAVTSILFDHFEIDRADADEAQRSAAYDRVFKPTLLQWSRLHTAGLQAFFRLWSTTGAETADFDKIEELVRILVEHVVGLTPRTRDLSEIEQELANYELRKLRELQMELLDLTHEDAWGQHLRQIKDELRHEALQFIREQRIRCLLAGAWFPATATATAGPPGRAGAGAGAWRFVRLSHNRRYLHHGDFDRKSPAVPSVDLLPSKIDISTVTSVVSDIHSGPAANGEEKSRVEQDAQSRLMRDPGDDLSETTTVYGRAAARYAAGTTRNRRSRPPLPSAAAEPGGVNGTARDKTTTVVTIFGYKADTGAARAAVRASQAGTAADDASEPAVNGDAAGKAEEALLTLRPPSSQAASEWLDGLLLLLNQTPITAETLALVNFVARYGLKIRMLNVRFEEGGVGAGLDEWGVAKEVELPSRAGVDDDFYYEIEGVA